MSSMHLPTSNRVKVHSTLIAPPILRCDTDLLPHNNVRTRRMQSGHLHISVPFDNMFLALVIKRPVG
jgi:hypothetical protein